MNQGRSVFAQVMDGLDRTEFERCARRFPLVRATRVFSAYDHFATMIFAQLTYRQSLRDIEACLNARPQRLYHSGIRGRVSRCNLAYANRHRSWELFAAVAAVLMRKLRRAEAAQPPVCAEVYAFDSSLVDVSLALCPWAHRQQSQAAVRLNVLLDTTTEIPQFASISAGNTHEVHELDRVPLVEGAFYVMDRGYLDFARLHRLHCHGVHFVVRAKSNLRCRTLQRTKVDRSAGLRSDHLIALTRRLSAADYPDKLRRIRFVDPTLGRSFVFLTNHPELPAATICELYRQRWQVELFFRWIKQHLRLRWFIATSYNGVRVQLWCALCAHLLIALTLRRLGLSASLYQLLQLVSVSPWERCPIAELFERENVSSDQTDFFATLNINES